jgi:heptosyltransferase-2
MRYKQYDLVINLQRFASSGILTLLTKGKESRGFEKNPLAFLFTKKFKHEMKPNWHEVDRNLSLISDLAPTPIRRPQLYPSQEDLNSIQVYQEVPYYCLAPTSVWFTKQAPQEIWLALIEKLSQTKDQIFLLGAPSDRAYLDEIVKNKKAK